MEARLFLGPCDRMEPTEENESEERHRQSMALPTLASMHIFPNPAEDQAQVVLPGDSEGILWVYDARGQKIHHTKVPAGMPGYILNLAGLPSGIYQVVFLSNTGSRRLSAFLTLSH